MAILTSLQTYSVPGVYIRSSTFGAVPAGLASHYTVYLLGFSNQVGAPTGLPTYITSATDFSNVFGTSASTNSIKLFFDNLPGTGLYFIAVPPKATRTLATASPTVTPGDIFSLTINSQVISYTAVTGDTSTTVITKLGDKVNLVASVLASVQDNKLRVATGVTVTASATLTLGTLTAAPAYPVVADVIDVINSLDSDLAQGFLLAPEFFQQWESRVDRTALANAMDAKCADPRFMWVSLVDSGQVAATATYGYAMVNEALADRSGISSPSGHSGFFYPYLKNLSDQLVPASAAVAGVQLRRMKAEGFRQPAAGVTFPVLGVKGTSVEVTEVIQGQLNPQGINCIRNLRNKGTVIYGARTLSTSAYWRYLTTRVIMNVAAGTLRSAFDEFIFTTVDGLGILFSQLTATCTSICERLRTGGALYGATPQDAYLIICDDTNNPPDNLENGIVNVKVYVKPSPLMEFLDIELIRTSIGTTLTSLASGQSSNQAPGQPGTSTSGGTNAGATTGGNS